MAVLPSADSAIEVPWSALPSPPVPTSFGPCCVNCASASCDEKSSAATARTAPNNVDGPVSHGALDAIIACNLDHMTMFGVDADQGCMEMPRHRRKGDHLS